jgi:hypothetical protein
MNLINQDFENLVTPNSFLNDFGTYNMAIVLYSLIRFSRPEKVLEIGAGYTTLFLAQALQDIKKEIFSNNHQSFINDSTKEFYKKKYNPKLYVIDNFSQVYDKNYIEKITNSLSKLKLNSYVKLVNSDFWEYYKKTQIIPDFIWADFGNNEDYLNIINKIYPSMPINSTIIFHGILTRGNLLTQIKDMFKGGEISTFIEPHKVQQNSFLILKKTKF